MQEHETKLTVWQRGELIPAERQLYQMAGSESMSLPDLRLYRADALGSRNGRKASLTIRIPAPSSGSSRARLSSSDAWELGKQ